MEIWRILNGFKAFEWKYGGNIKEFMDFNGNMEDLNGFKGNMEEF
jgi:hypothetical protein